MLRWRHYGNSRMSGVVMRGFLRTRFSGISYTKPTRRNPSYIQFRGGSIRLFAQKRFSKQQKQQKQQTTAQQGGKGRTAAVKMRALLPATTVAVRLRMIAVRRACVYTLERGIKLRVITAEIV